MLYYSGLCFLTCIYMFSTPRNEKKKKKNYNKQRIQKKKRKKKVIRNYCVIYINERMSLASTI